MPDYAHAVELLRAGELVAFPTETVYGLGADAANPQAVSRIFAVKNRPADHPLIVHLPDADALAPWARSIPPTARALAEAFWPGPLTLVLPRAPKVPDVVTGGQETVALRVPAHPVALELLRAFARSGGGREGLCGIAAPSANRFGQISPTRAEHVREEFGDAIPLVIDGGPCPVGIESTIVDLSRGEGIAPRILRLGALPLERIEALLGVRVELPDASLKSEAPRVPGSLAAHYAPRTPLTVIQASRLPELCEKLTAEGKKIGVLFFSPIDAELRTNARFCLPDEPEAYARALYDALRALDAAGCDAILAESVPDDSRWLAVADRLGRSGDRSQETDQ
ncbi:MAG: threonylcarbamoyl-AMP synthase [Candidatus Accumulibacter sp.]|jgi:L-threonylcarbamoyladenylate synthase|nr:threonylcarbamoyl-AMP synthase [Accumulibacter sp.]